MKKLYTLLAFAITIIATAQAPQGFNYQATVRNSSGALVVNQNVLFKFNIMLNSQTSLPVYSETHQAPTDDLGQVNLTVGQGTATTGTFSAINWANGTYFLGIELNTGTGFVAMGTTQLLSVPYALYANSAGSVGNASVNNLTFPTLITNSVTNINSNGATFNGNIGNYSSDKLLDKGFVCSLTPKPTYFVASMFNQALILSCGNSVGDFQYTTLYSDLLSNSTYYVRAYAVTENNIVVYGNELSFVTLAVGQTGPGGGIVFYDKGNNNGGWRYLESAPNDQSNASVWGCQNLSISTQNTIGSGESNTDAIVANCNEPNIAARLCKDLVVGGQNDWFLPSIDEFYLLYINLIQNNLGGFNTTNSYWSSSQSYEGQAAILIGGGISGTYKSSELNVRAIRSF